MSGHGPMVLPEWLKPLMGERERLIANDRDSVLIREGLEPYQQSIESPTHGTFTIDSKRRMIIG